MSQYTPRNASQQHADRTFRQLGGQVVALRVDWARRLGSIHSAIVLQQLIFEARHHADDEGWFFLTAEDMQEHTAVGERAYHTARTSLAQLGLIETKRAGVPAKTYIRLNTVALDDWIRDVPDTQLPPGGTDGAELVPTVAGTRTDGRRNKNLRSAELLRESISETEEDIHVGHTPALQPKDIVNVWAEVCNGGVWPVNKGPALRAAKTLVDGGITPDDARSLIAWMQADDFWGKKAGIDLGKMVKAADAWRSRQSAAQAKRERLVY